MADGPLPSLAHSVLARKPEKVDPPHGLLCSPVHPAAKISRRLYNLLLNPPSAKGVNSFFFYKSQNNAYLF